ncbi:hypothetical protein DLH72_03670 [Candidatus Gracilibacteria bacterium]|nr:MAG: hypothetical protein DLH72_03670 [Candidatus Gracilibacteria bacterium]
METINIDKLNLSELKDLLKEVKLYRDLKTQLGDRAEKIYNKIKKGEKTLSVEYFPAISKELAFDESKKIFKNIFNLDVEEKDVLLKENEQLRGGMRVYMDDKVVDLSYLKIERELSK